MTNRSRSFAVRSPADLLAAVPYLLGFHPADSVVALGVADGDVVFAARADLPESDDVDSLAAYVTSVVARQDVTGAVVVGYGAPEPVLLAVRDALESADIRVYDVLHVADGRYRSALCTDPGCCDPGGTPFDVLSSPVAAALTYDGAVALPDRHALVAAVAPVGGLERVSMRRATARADDRLEALWVGGRDAVLGAAAEALRDALGPGAGTPGRRDGGPLSDDEVAWLSVLLCDPAVRDLAWRQITDPRPHVELWREVVRRAEPYLVAAPACLLAFAAWQSGDGALASVALGRALDADSAYPLAVLLDQILRHGLPPPTEDDGVQVRT